MEIQYVTDPGQRARAAAAIARIIELDWPEGRKRQLPTVLLRALCDLAGSPESPADDGWEPLAIAQAMVKLGAHWPKLTEEDARLRINSHWKILEPLWSDRRESVLERLADDGFDLDPRLEKLTGGGAGKRTRYRLQFFPLTSSSSSLVPDTQIEEVGDHQPLNVDVSPTLDTRGGKTGVSSIRYYAVPMRLPGSDTQQPIEGLQMGLLMNFAFFVALTFLIYLVLGAYLVLLGATSSFTALILQLNEAQILTGDLYLNLKKAGVFSAVFLAMNLSWWMIQLDRNRVSVPPLALRLGSFDKVKILFELHDNSNDRRKHLLHILSYVADCPICGADGNGRSSIRPASGGREFHGRIVGRCAYAPQEHVWSFDHITRTGRFLR